MLMTEFDNHQENRTDRGLIDRRAIVIVSQPCFLMECLEEVLRRKFPDSEILASRDLADFPDEICADARLVLFYNQDMARLSELIRNFRRKEVGVALGIVIDGLSIGVVTGPLIGSQKGV